MRLNRLEARNYRLHSHLIVDFDALGSFTVTGPNGVGKSSFIEAIRYALKGKHRSSSGAGASRIVKLGTTTCVVTLDFSVLGGRYRVVRKRLTTGRGKGELELYQILDDGALIALTEGNADATQARLDLLVGVDDDTLMATSYVAQGDAARFSGATPSGRKAVLRSVLRIEEFRPAAREARERQRAHAVSADAHESNALGLETAEGELAEVQARLRELEEAMTTAATDATAARVTLSTAERALAGVEARARQAAEAAATRARQVAQVNRLGQDVERLTAEVARLTAAASAEVSANGGRAAALIPELEHQRAQLNGALAGAAIRQGEQRGLKSTVEGIRARLDALRVELETPLPDLGEPLEVLEARVSELPALRARVDATMRAASEHEVLTRRLEELAVNGRALSERIAEHRVEPALLSSEETAASGLQAARERLSALAVQVADRTALEGQLARLRASIAAFRSDLAALPPPPADLETVRARAAGLTEASENRRAIAARAAAAADQLKVATERLSAAREAASLATHKAEAAARELLGNARAACQDSSPWRAPDGREVELFTACPLSARLATLERDQPALRSAAEAAEADAQAARREVAGLGISQADAAEALAKADAEVDAATAATARLREIERQSAARLELEAELSRVEGRIPDAEAALSALAGVAAAHASALADVDHAQRATDRLAVLRTRVERVTAWEAERETARAEWQRVHNAHAAAGDVEQAWRAAMRERTTADADADLLARHRTALARRERAQAGVKSVQE
jgi:DNA repair exonuclease SbcCD ATPase subunit